MPEASFPYSERILQWVWNELLFDNTCLRTECGKPIQIIHQGILNHSDGPDFKSSKLLIGNIEWNGSVELHLKSSGWKAHNHHSDQNYDNVILHVVAEENPSPVSTLSGSSPFTLNLLPYIHSDLGAFLSNLDHSKKLPCTGNLTFISEDVFHEQIARSHQEYLNKKIEDFLSFYTSDAPQSTAWKNALIVSVFDGFGISRNREQMRTLAYNLLNSEHDSLHALQSKADYTAFSSSEINWNFKGTRPHSHPTRRIKTAVHFLHLIKSTPFEDFLNADSYKLWNVWCSEIGVQNAGHPKILYATVFLPALYFLGKLYHSEKITATVKEEWNSFKAPIPKILLSEFAQLKISPSFYQKKLGSIHQLREYCKPKNCSECLVLKKAFSS
ncbi:MAG: DUF2851 family protein [Balneola sp.]